MPVDRGARDVEDVCDLLHGALAGVVKLLRESDLFRVELGSAAAQKGGATKTAVACNIGPLLAVAGRRTLLVDLDQQADLTARFGSTPETLDYSMVDVLAPRNSVPIVMRSCGMSKAWPASICWRRTFARPAWRSN